MNKNIKFVSFCNRELLFVDDKLAWISDNIRVEDVDEILNLGIKFYDADGSDLENHLIEVDEFTTKTTWSEFVNLAKEDIILLRE